MTPSKVILLTGFEPFGGSDVNPSLLACRKLEGTAFNGYTVHVGEIRLRFDEIRPRIEELVETYDPAAVISTGQSSRPYVSLERVAINVADATRLAYNCGKKPRDEPLVDGGPAAYFSRLPLRELLEELNKAKIPEEISNTAGTFGCNQIFYHLMGFIERKGLDILAGFIHVPSLPEQTVESKLPSMSLDLTAKALEIVVETLSLRLRFGD